MHTLAPAEAPAGTHDLPDISPPGREKQPPGLLLLFRVEMCGRFSYYGMRGIFVRYLVNSLKWSGADASRLYGTYAALGYLTPIAGGWLGDRALTFNCTYIIWKQAESRICPRRRDS